MGIKYLIQNDDFCIEETLQVLQRAILFKQNPKNPHSLKNKTVVTLFFENSTRTKSSFIIASQRLGANIFDLDVNKSSTSKGETLKDTALTLNAMLPDAIVIRHHHSGVPKSLASMVNCPVINAGDGAHAHPTQALLDLMTIYEHFNGELQNKKIAIVGDIKNSRVANSNCLLLKQFGLDITLVAPPHFLPKTTLHKTSHDLKKTAKNVDIIMSLRTQAERHSTQTYGSLKDYAGRFCITNEILDKGNILILHPGPVHRNIDLSDEVLDSPRCKVLEQVKNGVFIRMAVLEKLIFESQ